MGSIRVSRHRLHIRIVKQTFGCVIQAKLLKDEALDMDSMNLLGIMAPIAVVMLIPAIAVLEPNALRMAIQIAPVQPTFAVFILGNSSLAYIVNYSNFQITKSTSALTMQVR